MRDTCSDIPDGTVYFDTSSWNALAKRPDRGVLINLIRSGNRPVLASVVSLAEVLRTPDPDHKRLICSTMRALHGGGPLLERPLDIARAAAEAFLKGHEDFPLPVTGPGNYLHACMLDPDQEPSSEIAAWLGNMNHNVEEFINANRPPERERDTVCLSLEVLEGEDFLNVLCRLPPTRDLGISVPQMRDLCKGSDVWRALGATIEYIIQLATSHSPKNWKQGKHRRKRPDGSDLWQAVYLGVAEVFVTDDAGMLRATSEIDRILRYPRCVVHSDDFLNGILQKHTNGIAAGATPHQSICPVCGSAVPTRAGRHAMDGHRADFL